MEHGLHGEHFLLQARRLLHQLHDVVLQQPRVEIVHQGRLLKRVVGHRLLLLLLGELLQYDVDRVPRFLQETSVLDNLDFKNKGTFNRKRTKTYFIRQENPCFLQKKNKCFRPVLLNPFPKFISSAEPLISILHKTFN